MRSNEAGQRNLRPSSQCTSVVSNQVARHHTAWSPAGCSALFARAMTLGAGPCPCLLCIKVMYGYFLRSLLYISAVLVYRRRRRCISSFVFAGRVPLSIRLLLVVGIPAGALAAAPGPPADNLLGPVPRRGAQRSLLLLLLLAVLAVRLLPLRRVRL